VSHRYLTDLACARRFCPADVTSYNTKLDWSVLGSETCMEVFMLCVQEAQRAAKAATTGKQVAGNKQKGTSAIKEESKKLLFANIQASGSNIAISDISVTGELLLLLYVFLKSGRLAIFANHLLVQHFVDAHYLMLLRNFDQLWNQRP